ncbi:MAG: hypothetical protein A2Y10_17080 [Planctomycetes bacterium GWF2_41_51]|nr:MAG: hypothetical protein A2Y10_17080 [Planctomycetes bacterium GWF2_41_51]HBG27163.1 hypothetical protein [Phycisphaerales bacterium]
MWYYVRDNQRTGPIDESAIDGLIQNGTVLRQTLVWKEGMSDWQKAEETELAEKFAIVLPATPSTGLTTYSPSGRTYTAESLHKLWVWFTCLYVVGSLLAIIFIGIPAIIAGIVLNYILVYRFWALIQDGKARTTPGIAVGFCFIPFFNIYWLYVAYVGLAKDINLYCRERSINGPFVNEGLALTWYILAVVSIIPYVGFVTAIPAIIIHIILMKQFVDISKEIIISKTKQDI